MPRGGSTQVGSAQIPALTGLRFFAALFILFAHASDWLGQFSNSDVRQNFSFVAMYGMPLFFVLSGFVIHYTYKALFLEQPWMRAVCEFAVARFSRLFPLYAVLLFMALWADNFFVDRFHSYEFYSIILSYISLTQSWWYSIYGTKPLYEQIFDVSWSVSTEMFFYASYVFSVFAVSRLRGVRLSASAFVIYPAVVMILFLGSEIHLSWILQVAKYGISDYVPPARFNDSFYRWLFYISPYCRVFEFIMGALTAQLFMELRVIPVSRVETAMANWIFFISMACLVSFGALYLGVIFGNINPLIQHLSLNFLCAPPIAYILLFVSRYDTKISRFLSRKILIALGEASYSIYLVHTWILRIFLHAPGPLNMVYLVDALARVACGMILTFIVATATYKMIEMPCRAWLRAKLSGLIAAWFSGGAAPASAGKSTPSIAALGGAFAAFALVIVGGQAARSQYFWYELARLRSAGHPMIKIDAATYGFNCKSFHVPPPFVNSAAYGNATKDVERQCEYQTGCKFRVDVSDLGDPANRCSKDFSVSYRCTGTNATKYAYVAGEANGKLVRLSCPGTGS